MKRNAAQSHSFLLLQGPHGPFFHQLGKQLRAAGAQVWRIGFNAGDQAFWRHKQSYIANSANLGAWPKELRRIIAEKQITDIVLYGDTRPIHAAAIEIASELGLTVHVFEEGYLRPYWITYERGGANGHSPIMGMKVDDMEAALRGRDTDIPTAPGHWGSLRQHVFYGALYHWFVMFRNGDYPHFERHRNIPVSKEFRLYIKRLLRMPFHWSGRIAATRRIKRGGYPYHLALLQLEHDASFRDHSPFETMSEFLHAVVQGFADGAPSHHHLVFKTHPLEDGRVPLANDLRSLAQKFGIEKRVHLVRGGKLAGLLNHANSAVTVNSTSAQQALWRALPLKSFGDAVYNKPEFTSQQSIADFFNAPQAPDSAAYRIYREFLLETSQISGSYYAASGRRRLLRNIVDMMLAKHNRYENLTEPKAAAKQQLSLVK